MLPKNILATVLGESALYIVNKSKKNRIFMLITTGHTSYKKNSRKMCRGKNKK